jgi:hypothetical protein
MRDILSARTRLGCEIADRCWGIVHEKVQDLGDPGSLIFDVLERKELPVEGEWVQSHCVDPWIHVPRPL